MENIGKYDFNLPNGGELNYDKYKAGILNYTNMHFWDFANHGGCF